MVSCKALVQQLHSGSLSQQHQAVAALSTLPLTSQNWLSAVAAIPRLIQLLSHASTTAPRAGAIQRSLLHIARCQSYSQGGGDGGAPDGVIPPLVPLLLHDIEDVCHVAAMTIATLAARAGNTRMIIEAGAVAPLVQLLKSSSDDLLYPATQALAYLAVDADVARVLAVDALAPLLQLLVSSSTSESVQLRAARAVAAIADGNAGPVTAAGAIPLLAQLLKSSSEDMQREALRALYFLTNANVKAPVVTADTISLLADLLRASGPADVRCVAAQVLGHLVAGSSAQSDAIAARAIDPLVSLLQSSTEKLQYAALAVLVTLSEGNNKANQAKIVAVGAIDPIVRILKAAASEQSREAAVMMLATIVQQYSKLIAKAGAIPLLVKCLTDNSTTTQEVAAYALGAIAITSDNHAAILAAAPLLPLVHLLTSSSEKAQVQAQTALVRLSYAPSFSTQFVAADAIPPLVNILRSESASLQQRAMLILGILTTKGRADIVVPVGSAGALPLLAHLQTCGSSEAVRHHAEKLLLALTTGESMFSPSAMASIFGRSSHQASAAGSPTSTAAASPIASAQQLPPPRPRNSCWSCGAAGMPLKKCSGCAVAAYCGAGCQKADWKAHKGQCARIKAGASGSGSSAAGLEK